jgi:hypothetical protein
MAVDLQSKISGHSFFIAGEKDFIFLEINEIPPFLM